MKDNDKTSKIKIKKISKTILIEEREWREDVRKMNKNKYKKGESNGKGLKSKNIIDERKGKMKKNEMKHSK